MATIDEDLSQIERDIRTLKIEYEQFFGGGRKRPPTDTQWRLDNLVRKCNEKIGELNFGQRFRLNNLTQTYAKYQDFWRKKTAQRETGAQQRHFGAAAKAIEAERESKRAAEGHETAVEEALPARRDAFAMSFSQPEKEREKIETLYQKLIEARNETGERSGAPSLQDFEKFVRNKTKDLKSKGGNEVEYTVSVEDGKVRLKARIAG
ncbi:MAG TPA: MXAN_5187 C-terminal domain-containing protein [Candidatus Aquilonibacter sp.]|nr:MXAN_5187 C-terminal domain-containing protein [Candidatus Aquilonibacter sp.]